MKEVILELDIEVLEDRAAVGTVCYLSLCQSGKPANRICDASQGVKRASLLFVKQSFVQPKCVLMKVKDGST